MAGKLKKWISALLAMITVMLCAMPVGAAGSSLNYVSAELDGRTVSYAMTAAVAMNVGESLVLEVDTRDEDRNDYMFVSKVTWRSDSDALDLSYAQECGTYYGKWEKNQPKCRITANKGVDAAKVYADIVVYGADGNPHTTLTLETSVTVKESDFTRVESVLLSPTELTMTTDHPDDVYYITAMCDPADADNASCIEWMTSDPSVANVVPVRGTDGTQACITAYYPGTAEIKAYVGGVYTVCKVTVKPGPGWPGAGDPVVEETAPSVLYKTHVQTYGWQNWVKDGAVSGTVGQSKRLEGINIKLDGVDPAKLGVTYTTHCQSYGWLKWVSNGAMSGTSGEAKRLEAIMMKLTGSEADKYDIYYRVHAQSYGWLNWAKNGEPAGTEGLAKRLEGIQIVVVKKGEQIDQKQGGIKSVSSKAYVSSAPVKETPTEIVKDKKAGISYRVHVQTYGWQGWKADGKTAGTTGEGKRLEAIYLKLDNQDHTGGLSYRTHVQKYGWQKYVGTNKMSGTSGEGKRLEAIEIKLTGDMAKYYDVYYRVHAQTYGWLGWAKNGQPAGTEGLGKRLESLQVVLVKKGDKAPGSTARAYIR